MAFTRTTQVRTGIISPYVRSTLMYGLVIVGLVVGAGGTSGFGQSPPANPAGNVAPSAPAPKPQEVAPPPATAKPSPAVLSQPSTAKPQAGNATPVIPAGIPPPPDYVIGTQDVLTVYVWREKEMSGDVSVRPDGKISLPLMNEIHAAGLTPEQLRAELTQAAGRFIEDPTVTVVVKEIHSRKVYVTGMINRPGPYPLTGPTTVLQMLAIAGGVLEYADAKNIMIMRIEKGQPSTFKFNYKDVAAGKNLKQNIELRPGDTIVVP
jgi:polysaccharide export outer membrane protein